MKHGKPQAKDFVTLDVLRAVARLRKVADNGRYYNWVMRWELADATGMPEKVCLAKMGALKRQGFIECCNCGCRGDIELTESGATLIGVEVRPK